MVGYKQSKDVLESKSQWDNSTYSLSTDYMTRTGNPDEVPIIVNRSESRCVYVDYVTTVPLVAAKCSLCRCSRMRQLMLSAPEYRLYPIQLAV